MPYDLTHFQLTGIEAIDTEHAVFVEMLNELHEMCQAEVDNRYLKQAIIGIFGFLNKHFETEECCCNWEECPIASELKAAHDIMRARLEYLQLRIESDGLSQELLTETICTLGHWFTSHISHCDNRIGRDRRAA